MVGKRLPRVDAVEKATGIAKYTGDIKLPGMLVCKVLRSPYPHAGLVKVDKSKAESLLGVEAVVTLQDLVSRKAFIGSYGELPLIAYGAQPNLADQYIFTDKARFVGDPIAAVAAVSESIAAKALELIEVEYEILPAVFDVEEAVKPGAPLIHDAAKNNVAVHWISLCQKVT